MAKSVSVPDGVGLASTGTGLSRNMGIMLAVLTAVAYSGSGPFVKPLILDGWTPTAAVWFRITAAAAILLPFGIWSARRDLGVFRRNWRFIGGYGLIAVAASQLFYYSALSLMPVGIALLLQYLAPVLLLLVAWARTKHRPATMSLVGSVLSVAGLLLALDLTQAAGVNPVGVMFGLLAALAACGYYLLAAGVPDELPSLSLLGAGLAVASVLIGVLGVVGLLPMHFTFDTVELMGAERPWWQPMFVVVFVGTICGYLGGILAAKAVGSRLASFLGLLEVIASLVVSALLLGEVPTLIQFAGATLVILGVVCVRLAPDTVSLAAPLGPITAPITLPITLPPQSAAAARASRGESGEDAEARRQLERVETGRISVIDLGPGRAALGDVVDLGDSR